MNNNKSPHIINAATNLVGFTFIVLPSLKAFHLGQRAFTDEFVAVTVSGFMLSTLQSFMSWRSVHKIRQRQYENLADYVFFSSLLVMFIAYVAHDIRLRLSQVPNR